MRLLTVSMARVARHHLNRTIALPLLIAGMVALAHAQSPMDTQRVRGTIVSVSPDSVRVQTSAGGPLDVRLGQDTRVAQVSRAGLEDIRAGSYVGTAAVAQEDGSLRALEVHIFDERMRGMGDGHRPWDLGTNSSMTNGTVGDVVLSQGRTLTVRYHGGEQKIVVPESAPIVRIAPGDRSLIVPGAHVMVFAKHNDDGSLSAQSVSVGTDGLVPPM